MHASRSLLSTLRAVASHTSAAAPGRQSIRHFAAAVGTEYRAATFRKHGNFDNTLNIEVHKIPELQQGEVQIKMLAAPISRTDVADVQGTLPHSSSQQLPAVAGNEGVGQVEKVGAGVSGVKVGDWVVPRRAGFGTWRSYAVAPADDVIVVPKSAVPAEVASLVGGSAVTALRLLEDFVELKEGDTVLLSGAEDVVGSLFGQLAHLRGIKTISVISADAPKKDETVERLKNFGHHIVVDDEYVKTSKFRDLITDLPAPRLALNGSGGDAATELCRHLAPGGTVVTFAAGHGADSGLTIPASRLMYNDITARGFWLTRWQEANSDEAMSQAVNQIVPLIASEKVRLWLETRKFSHFWNDGYHGFNGGKAERTQILNLHE
eukprot:TRINITY_DN4752_c0_g1_i1.p1 TRINITY_DN4752_c0_g1~~TRINITY_DN4752_c0_g1_i1.p1  ORF type:complete len:378 (-),score=126.58 TRINITY_DN4752_c0_g1_i1:227-1360(-)